MKYDVYRNLHRKTWSLREHGGLVVGHPQTVMLYEVTFHVGKKGRERVIREKRKNVHAYVCGQFGRVSTPNFWGTCGPVTYNPYKAGYFYSVAEGETRAIKSAQAVICDSDGRLYAQGITFSNE